MLRYYQKLKKSIHNETNKNNEINKMTNHQADMLVNSDLCMSLALFAYLHLWHVYIWLFFNYKIYL